MRVPAIMDKKQFLLTLKQAIKHQAKPKNADCRCADCSSERQSRLGKTGDASLKRPYASQ